MQSLSLKPASAARGWIAPVNFIRQQDAESANGNDNQDGFIIIKEGEGVMQECEDGAMMDAGIIGAGQKIEHYEIAAYGTLRTFAETLGLEDVAALLEETLEEEKAGDEKLTGVAESTVNLEAAEEEDE